MTTRTWFNGYGDFYSPLDWTDQNGVTGDPLPDDTLLINAGTVVLNGSEAPQTGVYRNEFIQLGGPGDFGGTGTLGATLDLVAADVGSHFNITQTLPDTAETLLSTGQSFFAGQIIGAAGNTTLTLATQASGSEPGALTIEGLINPQTLDIAGDVVIDSRYIAAADSVINTATLTVINSSFGANSLAGNGVTNIGLGGTLTLENRPSSSINFDGVGAQLDLAPGGLFSDPISGFAPGDTLDLTNEIANAVSYSAATNTLYVSDSAGSSSASVAEFVNFSAAAGSLIALSDGGSGTDIVYAGSEPSLEYEIAAGDRAMGANIVRATMTVPGTSIPITGAGVKIGIISDSFDNHATGTADPANVAAAEGYIPAHPDGSSAVNVLADESDGAGTNEGLAMAELIHQVAPGATLDFATGENAGTGTGTAVQALQADGCNIIVSDLYDSSAPIFQVAGPAATAAAAAIASGVNYFVSAGNLSDDYLSSSFNGTRTTLSDGSVVTANLFDNGTVYEPIAADYGQTYMRLTWNAPSLGADGSGAPAPPVEMKLFDSSGSLVATSFQDNDYDNNGDIVNVAQDIIILPASGTYELAIFLTGTATISQFYLANYFSTPGIIIDPAAGNGPGELSGDQLVPGANVVGAASWAGSPAFGGTGDFPESFTDSGPGELLYDSNGNPLSTPQSAGGVSFTAPDGIDVEAPGFGAFYGTSAAAPNAAAVAALMLQANPRLSTGQVTSLLEQSATPLTNTPGVTQGAGLIQAVQAVELAESVACYVRGTRIATPGGAVAIEDLCVGDTVCTAAGPARAITWIGRRRFAAALVAERPAVRPICIRAGALDDQVPVRDLFVSPEHALYLDGVLIPAACLVNGISITPAEDLSEVEYFHLELARHDVIIAEGAFAESYLDEDNRLMFDNAGDDVPALISRAACAPRRQNGPAVGAIRERLAQRAGGGGVREHPVVLDTTGATRAIVPADTRLLRLVSSCGATEGDRRTLGALITALRLDGVPIDLNGAALLRGFYPVERHGAAPVRWTNGEGVLALEPADHTRVLHIEIAALMPVRRAA